jgi:hypothetical protein
MCLHVAKKGVTVDKLASLGHRHRHLWGALCFTTYVDGLRTHMYVYFSCGITLPKLSPGWKWQLAQYSPYQRYEETKKVIFSRFRELLKRFFLLVSKNFKIQLIYKNREKELHNALKGTIWQKFNKGCISLSSRVYLRFKKG